MILWYIDNRSFISYENEYDKQFIGLFEDDSKCIEWQGKNKNFTINKLYQQKIEKNEHIKNTLFNFLDDNLIVIQERCLPSGSFYFASQLKMNEVIEYHTKRVNVEIKIHFTIIKDEKNEEQTTIGKLWSGN